MNYIQEINAFYDWLEGNPPLSNKAISLWYALMHINNKTKWVKTFHAAISTLETKSGIGRTELFKARKELEAAGLISWKQRDKMQCACYNMIALSSRSYVDLSNEFDDQIGDDYYDITGLRDLKDAAIEVGDQLKNDTNNHEIHDQSDDQSGIAGDFLNNENCQAINSSFSEIEDYVGNNVGNKIGNNNGNKNGSKLVTISKQNKTKQKETKQQFDEDEISSLSSANDDKEEKSSSSSADDVKERKKNKIDVLKFFNEYNRLCTKLPRARKITSKRKAHVQARLDEYGADDVQKMLELAGESDFLAGCNKNGWNANFDWLFLPSNFLKVLENQYANNPVTGAPSRQSANGYPYHQNNRGIENYVGKPSHLEIIEQTYQTLLNDGTFDN